MMRILILLTLKKNDVAFKKHSPCNEKSRIE